MSECLFCQIASRKMEAQVVLQGEDWIAFRDIHPQAPVHILIIPKKHIAALDQVGSQDEGLLSRLLMAAGEAARREKLEAFRVVINNGSAAGQSVFHLHLHLLGGRALGWPPG